MPLHESKGFSFSADEVLGLITPRTRLLILNSPANPTGGVVPKAELDRLLKTAADEIAATMPKKIPSAGPLYPPYEPEVHAR